MQATNGFRKLKAYEQLPAFTRGARQDQLGGRHSGDSCSNRRGRITFKQRRPLRRISTKTGTSPSSATHVSAMRKAVISRLGVVEDTDGQNRWRRPRSVPVEPPSHVAASDDERQTWERRRDEAQSAKEAEAAAAIRARLKRVVDLTQARLGVVADPKARAAKMVRLSEIQASLAANKDPKTLAIISQSFSEIEARLARLTAE